MGRFGASSDSTSSRSRTSDTALDFYTPSEMAVLIFTNNLKVSFGAFAFGITAGSVLLALYNGIHLEALLAACAQHELLGGILNFMAAHGPVELSIISLTAGAGLVIGHALVEPGERSRASWLKERAKLAVRLVLGCAPFLVAIGVVEGFVSPGAFFPWPLKALRGALSFVAFAQPPTNTRSFTRSRALPGGAPMWGIVEGDPEARITAAIAKTREFLASVAVPTGLGNYGVGQKVTPKPKATAPPRVGTTLTSTVTPSSAPR